MSKRLGAALDELRAAVFEAYAALAEEGAKTGTEQQRRESSLQSIDEVLEWRPLAAFSATSLELLEVLFAYWRETEVAEDVRPAPLSKTPAIFRFSRRARSCAHVSREKTGNCGSFRPDGTTRRWSCPERCWSCAEEQGVAARILAHRQGKR
jgi:hypothetical protein